MPYVFADESGNFDFSLNNGASKYFVLTTVTVADCSVGETLLHERRAMAAAGLLLRPSFHANLDDWPTRARVLKVVKNHEMRIDTTILEKRKAQPTIRYTDERFYQMAWYLHFKHVAPRIVGKSGDLFVVGSALGSKGKKQAFAAAVKDVVQQVSPTTKYQVASLDSVSDPCLQIADFCSWAINRKWEYGKDDVYKHIQSKVFSEFDVFRRGTKFYY